MAGQYTYDFNKVCLNVGGVIVSGYFAGSTVEAMQDGDNIEFDQGIDGQACMIVHSFDKLGSIKFTLNQGSMANRALTALYQVQRTTLQPVPILLTNILGGELATISQGAITKPADPSFSDKNAGRSWECKGVINLQPVGAIPV